MWGQPPLRQAQGGLSAVRRAKGGQGFVHEAAGVGDSATDMVPEGPLRIARSFTGGMCEVVSRTVGTIEIAAHEFIGWNSGVPPGRGSLSSAATGRWKCRAILRRPSGTDCGASSSEIL